MFLPKNAEKIIGLLESRGFKAYAVGGCVRDFLLERQTFDYDITTSATPSEVKSALSPMTVLETGLRHGTVTAVIDRERYEITTFRTEQKYTDHRHPESVCFSTRIEDDLMRRDFTINAIAYSHKEGYLDPYGGINDIKSGIIRAVGNAEERFDEDALRILRGLRFASCLGFSFEEKTANAIKNCFPLLSFISKERIFDELKKIICGNNAERVMCEFCEVFEFVLGAKISPQGVGALPPDFAIRFAFIIGDAPAAQSALIALKADNNTKKEVKTLLENLPRLQNATRTDLKHIVSNCGFELTRKSIILSQKTSLLSVLEDTQKSGEPLYLCDLAVGGADLLEIGVEKTKISTALNEILSLVIDGGLENDREKLINYAKKALF